ncbi:unnamed protein product [Sympodiomycopsis kandeliae]
MTSPSEKEKESPSSEIIKQTLFIQDDEKVDEHNIEAPVLHKHQLNLANNAEGKIVNVLAGIPKHELYKQVEEFAKQHDLVDHTEILQKGALAAQSPSTFEDMDEFDENEKKYLRLEINSPWRIPIRLWMTIACCCIGAALQGWDQTGSNGAVLSFPKEFNIAAEKRQPNYERDQWLVGLITSMPYLASALVGCWLSKPFNDWFGRRGCIFITGIILIAAPIGSAVTQTWPQLLITRAIMGLGMGAKGSTVPIFAAEHSPTRIRAGLTASWQLFVAFGLFIGYSANAVVAKTGTIAWRLQLGSAFIPALPMTLGIWFTPESPRWLITRNKYRDAFNSLCAHNHTTLQAARELYYAHCLIEIEREASGSNGWLKRFTELFTIPRVRRATLAAFVVMLAQQLCGINIIAFFSASIFVQAGFTELQALNVSIGFGALSFVFCFGANYTMDTWGRRFLLLAGFPQMFWTLLAAGLCFLIPADDGHARVAGVATFIFLFAIAYALSEGPVPYAYCSEVFPVAQREQGMAFGVAITLFFATVLSITFFRIQAAFGNLGSFGLYAGFNIVALILIFLFLPETKGRTLEELDQVFSVPTRVFAKYQVTKTLPFWIKRYVLRDRNARLEPLYKIQDQMVGTGGKE